MHIRNVIGKIQNNEPSLWMSLAGGNLYFFSKSKNNEVKRFVENILEERSDQMTRVVVALNDLETGYLISADQIATTVFPKDELPNDYIAIEYASEILGKYPKKEVPAFFPLRWSHMGFQGQPETAD